ncbi:MAG: hypothetical protein LBF92_04435 [Synergistaceae bacterium]|nr:hypothetical protein [Synergistaceae bacterium]
MPREKRARHSFILLEALASLSILSMIVAGMTTGAVAMMETGNYVADAAAAQDRADQIFSMLKMPADFCGYGLPRSVDLYRKIFAPAALAPPFSWDGVISVVDTQMKNGAVRKNGTCRIVYGIRSGYSIMDVVAVSGDILKIRISGIDDKLESVPSRLRPDSLKNWALFGSGLPFARPLWLKSGAKDAYTGKYLNLVWNRSLSPETELRLHKNDELLYLGAIECNITLYDEKEEEGIFYIKDMRGGGRQPRENGVMDARFVLDPDRRVLRVFLLIRGNRRYEDIKTKGTPPGWPPDYAREIPKQARHYRLFAFSESFELKNN